jgi:1-acyl-sn-glycerol-3-phosphate acyltransferase
MKSPPFDWWRTVFFLIPTISAYTILLGTLSVLSTLVDRRGHAAHWCARAWSWLILATTGVEVSVTGLDCVDPGRTYVFVSNHQSIYDIPVIFASIPFQLRIIAKESLGRFPFLGWHLRRAGHLLVDRTNPDRQRILDQWRRLLANRICLIIFPEGTRSADGRVGRFKAGGFLLALEAGLTIVPLSISGSRHVMTKGRLATRPGHVTLTVHDPVVTPRIESPAIADARDLAIRIEGIVRNAVEVSARSAARDAGQGCPPSADRGAPTVIR